MYIYDTPQNSTSSSSHTTPTYRSDPAAHRRQAAWSWNSERETRSDHSSTHDPHWFSPHGLSSEARMSSEPSHQKQGFSRPRQRRRIGEDDTTITGKGEPRTAPPGIETVKNPVCPRTNPTGYPLMDCHQRPGYHQSPATR